MGYQIHSLGELPNRLAMYKLENKLFWGKPKPEVQLELQDAMRQQYQTHGVAFHDPVIYQKINHIIKQYLGLLEFKLQSDAINEVRISRSSAPNYTDIIPSKRIDKLNNYLQRSLAPLAKLFNLNPRNINSWIRVFPAHLAEQYSQARDVSSGVHLDDDRVITCLSNARFFSFTQNKGLTLGTLVANDFTRIIPKYRDSKYNLLTTGKPYYPFPELTPWAEGLLFMPQCNFSRGAKQYFLQDNRGKIFPPLAHASTVSQQQKAHLADFFGDNSLGTTGWQNNKDIMRAVLVIGMK